ncbi:hypothetical protein [Burkholderia ubonensis]|uniref:hypothetical protein n=1 Tax=Burkholderia ubonensis TaxID=101571 RepID=UPI000AE2FCFD|nr:hypothetical protein [Burkholderia ubonensis]
MRHLLMRRHLRQFYITADIIRRSQIYVWQRVSHAQINRPEVRPPELCSKISPENIVRSIMISTRSFIIATSAILSCLTGRAHASPEADFWNWFQRNEASLFDFERDQEKTFDRLATEMHKVHPNLTFEFGSKWNGQREFVISADGIRAAFSKVESLASSAPELPRWKVVKFRSRRDPLDIQYNGISVKASSVSVGIRPDGEKAVLTVFIPGYSASKRNTFVGIAFLFLDQALGEFDVETRVGRVDVQAPIATNSDAVPLNELPKAFDAFVAKR